MILLLHAARSCYIPTRFTFTFILLKLFQLKPTVFEGSFDYFKENKTVQSAEIDGIIPFIFLRNFHHLDDVMCFETLSQ